MSDESSAFLAQNRGFISSRISTVFVSISLFFLLLRLYTRGLVTRALGSEDYCMVLAWLLSFCYTSCTWFEDLNGQNRHIEALSAAEAIRMAKALYVSLMIYQAALVFIKSSFLCQYWRLFPTLQTRKAIRIIGLIVLAYGIYSITANVFICVPIAHFWSPKELPGSCINRKALWFTNAALNIATDLAILSIPLPSVNSLRISRAQKAGLVAIFAVGVFVCIVSVIRLWPLAYMVSTTDLTWADGPVAYWTAIEINTGIVCGCLPTLKPLVVRHIPRLGRDDRNDVADADDEVREMEIREIDPAMKTEEERADSVMSCPFDSPEQSRSLV